MVTTQIKGPEAIERAVLATLKTYLAAELAAIWAAWATYDAADGVSVPLLSPPIAFYSAGPAGVITDYPALLVISDTGRQPSNGAPGWGEVEHTLTVILWMVGDDQHILDKMVKRYLQGIWETLMKRQGADGTVAIVGIDPQEYGRQPAVKQPGAAGLLQVAGWTFVAHTLQSTSQG